MVDFHFYVGRFALPLVLNLVLHHGQHVLLHRVGRDEQFLELHRQERLFNEMEHVCHVFHNGWSRRHQQAVRIDLGIPFVEVSRSDTSNVVTTRHFDPQQLGMHFQALHTKDDVNACVLHALAPLDVT